MNGLLAALGVMLFALGAVVFALRAFGRRRATARRREALLKATRLVVDFEHTPVRGPSRDRSQHGKARRRARRS